MNGKRVTASSNKRLQPTPLRSTPPARRERSELGSPPNASGPGHWDVPESFCDSPQSSSIKKQSTEIVEKWFQQVKISRTSISLFPGVLLLLARGQEA